jgi:4-oxalocrotonate tautomerase
VNREEGGIMPVITVEAGKMDKAVKSRLIKELVAKAAEITKIPEQAFVTLIKENEYDNIGNGCKTLTEIISERK